MTGAEGYLLGLDISTFCTGFSVWNLNENKFESAGHITLKNVKDLHNRVDVAFFRSVFYEKHNFNSFDARIFKFSAWILLLLKH